MREAARSVGVSQAAPYRHFANKDALFDAIVLRGYAQLERQYVVALNNCRLKQDRLIAVAMAYYHFATDKTGLFALMFSSPRLQATAEAVSSYQVFEDEFAAAQMRGELPTALAGSQAQLLWVTAHGIADLVNRGVFSSEQGDKAAPSMLKSVLRRLS